MEKRRLILFAALFYPLAMALAAAGLLAFMMLCFGVDVLVVGSVVLWFYFISAATVFSLSKRALKMLGFYGVFLVLVLVAGALALLSTIGWMLGK
jgi:hypothetical protein